MQRNTPHKAKSACTAPHRASRIRHLLRHRYRYRHSPEYSETIFERFEKADNFGQGTGLGLNICRLIAERLKGKVLLDKEYKEGARFVFVLPVKNPFEEQDQNNKGCLFCILRNIGICRRAAFYINSRKAMLIINRMRLSPCPHNPASPR